MVKDICLLHQLFPLFYTSPNVRESKMLTTLRFWIPCCGFQIPGTKLWILCQWILDFNHYWDSGFVKKYFGLQNPGSRIPEFQIPKQKLPGFWYSDSLIWGETLRNEGTLGIHPLYSSIIIFIFQTRFYSLLNITQTLHLLANKFTIKLLYKV